MRSIVALVKATLIALLASCACGRISFELRSDGAADVAGDASAPIRSCVDTAPICGPNGTTSCCESAAVPTGTFARSYDGGSDALFPDMSFTATVSEFRLDLYEVSVSRFRAFVLDGAATQQRQPAPGSGAHPNIANSGWDAAWNGALASDVATLTQALGCDALATWRDIAGPNDNLPINCVTWYEAMAFCAWDGGFVPTEAEWNYAAAGGDEQRAYPWSSPPASTVIDCGHARYNVCSSTVIDPVGTYSPRADAKWGHSDLAGSLWEYVLDRWPAPYVVPCTDCADLTQPASVRTNRGGCFGCPLDRLRTSWRGQEDPTVRRPDVGWRCARPI